MSRETYIVGVEGSSNTPDLDIPIVWGCVALRQGDELYNPTINRRSPWSKFDEYVEAGSITPTPVEFPCYDEVRILMIVKANSHVSSMIDYSTLPCSILYSHEDYVYVAFKDRAEFNEWCIPMAERFADHVENTKQIVRAGLVLRHDNERLLRVHYEMNYPGDTALAERMINAICKKNKK